MKTLTIYRHVFMLFFLLGIANLSNAQIIINEVLADPASGSSGDANNDGIRSAFDDEFVELYNTSNQIFDLSGWRIADNANFRHTFPNGTRIPSNGSIVIFGGGNPRGDFGASLVQTASSGALGFSNSGDRVSLINPSGFRTTSFTYSSNQGSSNQSVTRSPDISGGFRGHASISSRLFSPGTRINGSNFSGNTNGGNNGNSELKIVTWNIEWFGNSNNGPSPENTQKERVKGIIEDLDADLYAIQEISNEFLMDELVDELPEYSWTFSTFTSSPPNDPGVSQKVAFIYKRSKISLINTQALLTNLSPRYNGGDSSLIADYPTNPSQFWSSGRMPYLLTANVTIGNTTERIYFINIHAKANSNNGPIRRAYDTERLKDLMDGSLPRQNVILLGDFNDDVEDGNSSYDDFVFDTASNPGSDREYYEIVTRPLDLAGEGSFVGSSRMIDHILISDELTDNYINGSATIHNEVVTSDFTSRTSDHIPVSARFSFGNTSNNRSATIENNKLVTFDQAITVYPNPTKNDITITVNESLMKNNDVINYSLYDSRGSLLNQGSLQTGANQVIDQHLLRHKGVYILKIQSGSEINTQRIVKY